MATYSPRVNLLGTWIDCVDGAATIQRIDAFIRARRPRQIVTVNLDFLRLGVRNPSFRTLVNGSDLILADGMPIVWASRLLKDPLTERVTGVDLVLDCARLAAERGYSVLLLGARDGAAEKTAAMLQARHPDLRIAAFEGPSSLPMSPDDEKVTVALIRAFAPDMLFVAFGAPYQDDWIRAHMDDLDVPVCMGVGGTFDMLSGHVSRAPHWMQNVGLEWLHRFRLEPKRLWKRYFVHDLPVFFRLMIQCSVGKEALQSAVRARDGFGTTSLERNLEPSAGSQQIEVPIL